MNNRRRNFRGRQQKNNFRRRSTSNHGANGHIPTNHGNKSFSRNGSLSNPISIEKVISKREENNPNNIKSFQYTSYNKTIFDFVAEDKKTDSVMNSIFKGGLEFSSN